MKAYLTIAAAIALVAPGAIWLGSPTAQAVAAMQNEETGLGGVKLVVLSGDAEATVQTLRDAAKAAGWAVSAVSTLNEVVLLPPRNYDPSMFGALLTALEQTGLQNFGLQLLDKQGRAIGPDGELVDN